MPNFAARLPMADLRYFMAVLIFVLEIVPEIASFLLMVILQANLFLHLLLSKLSLTFDYLPVTHVIENVQFAHDVSPAEIDLLLLAVHPCSLKTFPGLVMLRNGDIVIRHSCLRLIFLQSSISVIVANLRWTEDCLHVENRVVTSFMFTHGCELSRFYLLNLVLDLELAFGEYLLHELQMTVCVDSDR